MTAEEFVQEYRRTYGHIDHARGYVTSHPKDEYDLDDVIRCYRNETRSSIDTTWADAKQRRSDSGLRGGSTKIHLEDPLDEINRIYRDCERRGI